MSSNIINFIILLLGYCIAMPILILSVIYVVESYVGKGERDNESY